MSSDRIEKEIEIEAPLSRVWKALTDYKQFGAWFGVNLEEPFVPGETTRGSLTITGFEHVTFQAVVRKIEPERYFSFTWHPYAVELDRDYSQEEPTLVEFTLTETAAGTHVRVVESGFDKIPAHRRDEAFRMNEGGWAAQLGNIKNHVEAASQPAT
ncbi:SRPBCC family protein [Methyloceanibacter caenitepidi]|uniref:Activator of Hsp90 ATPase homologue 1/2-like C-terminal domain-containing protein n=1 Tax=Methyloceanibacter caenitepidi TaxID=1384459 RepID=A0A0A8K7A4_9HYPH|nr:SRPBCC family protein [Methyloceanibacter caenitepidi]BAQ18805.1 conserved hypothetical protein [Methyloceanibacter caenitepidi]